VSAIEKIRDFFKKDALMGLKKIEDIADLSIESLAGISPIHAKELGESGIKTIKQLSELIQLPKIKDLPEKILEKLNKTAMMLMDFSTRSAAEKKIIILGLDNAGKTSILSILQNKFSTIKTLLPTRGVSRQTIDFLGTSIICWDFGGQIAYRGMYLSRPDLFLESDLLIFVIDIQDSIRYKDSLDYLFQIMDIITKLKEKPPILIDLHKFDPDIQANEEYLVKRSELIDKIATKALELSFDCTFINTTIFIKETIEELFSLAIQKITTQTHMMEELAKEYCEKIDAKAVVLMTNDNLVITSYSRDAVLESVAMQSGLLLQALVDFFQKSGLKKEEEYSLCLMQNKLCVNAKKILTFNETELLIWGIFDSESKGFKDLDDFINALKPFIKMY
jgi:GTPase SAR1 family protein